MHTRVQALPSTISAEAVSLAPHPPPSDNANGSASPPQQRATTKGRKRRHHPYGKSSKPRGILRMHSADPAFSADPTSGGPLRTPSVASPHGHGRSKKLHLHDRCHTDEQRHLRQALLERNPHIAQAFFAADAYPAESFPFTRIITQDFPSLPYRERKNEMKSVLPWGQRRLLLAELEFLSTFAPTLPSSSPPCVLYAGAAPGGHLHYLSRLFPQLDFVLVDPLPVAVRGAPNVVVRRELFSDSVALDYSGRDVLFISDVRSADLFHAPVPAVDAAIAEDMSSQMRWHELLSPHRSLLKFRLPWTAGSTSYLDGELMLPVWGSQTTTECRLVPSTPMRYRQWEHTRYEGQMFHFNTRHRVQIYDMEDGDEGKEQPAVQRHRDRSLSGLDHCYDCTAELFVLRHFLLSYPAQQERIRQRILQQQHQHAASSDAHQPAPAPSAVVGWSPAAVHVPVAVITSVSPVSALAASVAQQHAVLESLIPRAIAALDIAAESNETKDGSSMDGVEADDKHAERAADEHKEHVGVHAASCCVCLDCLCVWLSDELSAELCEGRTLLTAPLLPAAAGTANIQAIKTQRKKRKNERKKASSSSNKKTKSNR